MKTLILDTASKFLYVSFLEDDKIIYCEFLEGKNNHSDNLLKVIEEGLNSLNMKVKDFNKIILGIGPGSYTGLRVSVTVAKMFSWTLNIPLAIISSLDLLSSGYVDRDGIYAVTMIAKKNHVYGKLIQVQNHEVTVLINDCFMEELKFLEIIKNYNYFLVNENNYLIEPKNLKPWVVSDLHQLTPNYIQREI